MYAKLYKNETSPDSFEVSQEKQRDKIENGNLWVAETKNPL